MFNPLKMNPIEKRLLIGGLANSLIYYGNLYAMNTVAGYPAELKGRVADQLPRNAEIIASIAAPATLYVAKKVVKGTTTKEKLADIGFGATLHGLPNLIHDIVVQTAYVAGAGTRTTALPLTNNISKYVPTPSAYRPSPSGLSKYVITG